MYASLRVEYQLSAQMPNNGGEIIRQITWAVENLLSKRLSEMLSMLAGAGGGRE